MKFKENMKGKYRVKMRNKVVYLGTNPKEADNHKFSHDHQSGYIEGKAARAVVDYHDGYRWERCTGW